jgi:hypothetical protein
MNKKVPKFGVKEDKRWCSPVMCCSWLLILMWTLFLMYCWKSGMVDQKKIKELVGEVDQAIVQTETSLHLRTPKTVPVSKWLEPGEVTSAVVTDGEMHVVFSTDCSEYQDWQTLLLFHSATVVGQKGRITRIASGCDDEKKRKLGALYKRLYPQFGVHHTPDFKKDAKTNKKCSSCSAGTVPALLCVKTCVACLCR